MSEVEQTQEIGSSTPVERLISRYVPVPGLLLVFSAMVGLWPAFYTMEWWWDASRTYSQGYLVVVIAGYLLLTALNRPWTSSKHPAFVLTALAMALLVWTLAYEADIGTLVMGLLPPILALALLAVAGWEVTRASLFPIGFLYFAIPVWELIVSLLQSATVFVVKNLLPLMGVSALVEGDVVTIPAGTFEIVGQCSGLHYFVVSLTLAALYGYLYLDTWRQKISLIGFTTVLALVTNWIRVATIIYVGDVTDMQHYLITVDHFYFGWALFGVSLFPFFIVARWLQPAQAGDGELRNGHGRHESGSQGIFMPVLVVTLIMLVSPAIFWISRDTTPITGLTLVLPELENWSGPLEPHPGWNPLYPRASGEARGRYMNAERQIDVYANAYLNQTHLRKVIGWPNIPYGERYQRVLKTEFVTVPFALEDVLNARQVVLADARGNKRLVLYWFLIGKSRTASESRAKAYQAAWGLLGNHDAGLITMSSACEDDCEVTAIALMKFAVASGRALEKEVLSSRPDDF